MKIKNGRLKSGIILGSIALVLFFVAHCKSLTLPVSPGFFPRAELSQIYQDYKDGAAQHPEEDPDDSIVAEAEIYYQNMRESRITGTLHQDGDREFVAGFDQYEPDQETEMINVIKDHGVLIYDYKPEIGPNLKNFDFFACQYKKNDLISRELSVVYEAGDRELDIGYVSTVYISVTGKVKNERRPLNNGPIVLKTREGGYFLKEFCVFWAYDSSDAQAGEPVQYQIKADGEEICRVDIP